MHASHKRLVTLGIWLTIAWWTTAMLGCGAKTAHRDATRPSRDSKPDAPDAPPNPEAAPNPDASPNPDAAGEPLGDPLPTPRDVMPPDTIPPDTIPPDRVVASDPLDIEVEPPTRGVSRPMVRDLLPRNSPPTRSAREMGAEPLDPVADDRPLAYRLDEPTSAESADSPALDTVDVRDSATDPDVADDQHPQPVTVFYATDRRVEAGENSEGASGWVWGLAGLGAAGALLSYSLSGRSRNRRGMRLLASGLTCLVFLGVGIAVVRIWLASDTQLATGVSYGNQRGELQLGTCQVSIPWSHKVGQVERPSLLRLEVREDVRKHVVLHETNQLDSHDFFTQLRKRVQAAPRPEVFVFVHGYNVTFAGAARRTAQITHDVEFSGAPIFFSWPSQGGLLKYTIDENNVEWAVPHLKQFLLDVTRQSGATHVNLIAHSMGNRALTEALREIQMQLQTESTLFNQVILAAPDIDAEIFCRDLAPALVQTARRVTLYASSRDQALVASKRVHGYARAGDSGGELVVLEGIETVDVSQLDTNLLGHSYYGSSNPILLDMRQLIERALPAAQREWLLPRAHGALTYWVFEERSAQVIREAKPL